jgi:hypothetical protein
MTLLAPLRFSTMKDCPTKPPSLPATSRAMASVGPPVSKGTTIRTAWLG